MRGVRFIISIRICSPKKYQLCHWWCRCLALQIMVGRFADAGIITKDFVLSLPECLPVGDFFTGAGTFKKVIDALFSELRMRFKVDTQATRNLFRTFVA